MTQRSTMAWAPLAAALTLLAVAAVSTVAAAAATHFKSPANYTFYPCTQCHATMQVTGLVKSEPMHNINLAKGAHRGLYCVNCHSVPDVWNMKTPYGKVEIAIPGMMNRSELMKMNEVCLQCHPRTVHDFDFLVHGNKTYTCPDGDMYLVKGYKGVGYWFHDCPEYRNLEAKPARACVECHDPHVGHYFALKPLPPHDERPPPPDQEAITYGTLAVAISSMSLILAAAILLPRYNGRS
ncbi:MAG: hypothetical protein GXO15_03135 [Crenarchaeota archaeon]|nr:hypothetical protein [Thermoproteota archaeon]